MANADIVLTAHAEDMLVEREIDRSWVEATILNPAALEADPSQTGAFRAFRRIPERGDRYLRVVYIREADRIRVITAFFDRGRDK
jgi:Domain of unknown function (DUF4258)